MRYGDGLAAQGVVDHLVPDQEAERVRAGLLADVHAGYEVAGEEWLSPSLGICLVDLRGRHRERIDERRKPVVRHPGGDDLVHGHRCGLEGETAARRVPAVAIAVWMTGTTTAGREPLQQVP